MSTNAAAAAKANNHDDNEVTNKTLNTIILACENSPCKDQESYLIFGAMGYALPLYIINSSAMSPLLRKWFVHFEVPLSSFDLDRIDFCFSSPIYSVFLFSIYGDNTNPKFCGSKI